MLSLVSLLTSLALANASPVQPRQARPFQVTQQQPWNAGGVSEWQIHPSCNGSQRAQLEHGLKEAIELAEHAKAHINRWGTESTIYRRWFGNRPTVEALGSYDILINGDRTHALFRCDDPDLQCTNQPTWGGHYRGSNATTETVICPPSFLEKLSLPQICSRGWDVRTGNRLIYWSSDLIHRLYHLPAFGQEYIDHFAEGYEELVEAAAGNSVNSTHDSDGLQYFALEAYAFDVIEPGVGCPGEVSGGKGETTTTAVAGSSATRVVASSATSAPAASQSFVATVVVSSTSTETPESVTGTGPAQSCHTHSDGEVHCT